MKSRRALFLAAIVLVLSLLLSRTAMAITIKNDSANKIAAGILLALADRNQPVFLKLLDPRNSLEFNSEAKGNFIVSVANLETKETTRLEGVQKNDNVSYDGKKLKKN